MPSPIGQANGLTPIAFTIASGGTSPSLGFNLVPQPCQLFVVSAGNATGGVAFLKLYDVALNTTVSGIGLITSLSGAVPTATFIIPGNAAGAGTNVLINGLPQNAGGQFTTGLSAQVTANAPATDTSAVSGNINVTLFVKA